MLLLLMYVTFMIITCIVVISVPPLEGFVMNRVLGDYFETLLYKIFVSIDEHTPVSEVCMSMFCFSFEVMALF